MFPPDDAWQKHISWFPDRIISRQELSNEYFLANFGFDTADNEPDKTPPRDLLFTYIPRPCGSFAPSFQAARRVSPRRSIAIHLSAAGCIPLIEVMRSARRSKWLGKN